MTEDVNSKNLNHEPDHVAFGRKVFGISPLSVHGTDFQSTLKSVRWRCKVEETYTEPEDDYHVIELKCRGGPIYRLDNKSAPIINRTVTMGPAASSALWVSDGVVEFSQLFLCTQTFADIARSIYGDTPVVSDDELMPEAEGIVDLTLAGLIEYCEQVVNNNHFNSQLELDALGQLMGAYIVRNRSRLTGVKPKSGSQGLSERSFSQVLDYIEEHISEDLTLNILAKISGLSAYHFSRAFKLATNASPHQYVLERRIIRAREKLENHEYTIADVAYTVGFSSQAHMTDIFNKRLGITPGKYRKDILS